MPTEPRRNKDGSLDMRSKSNKERVARQKEKIERGERESAVRRENRLTIKPFSLGMQEKTLMIGHFR